MLRNAGRISDSALQLCLSFFFIFHDSIVTGVIFLFDSINMTSDTNYFTSGIMLLFAYFMCANV